MVLMGENELWRVVVWSVFSVPFFLSCVQVKKKPLHINSKKDSCADNAGLFILPLLKKKVGLTDVRYCLLNENYSETLYIEC